MPLSGPRRRDDRRQLPDRPQRGVRHAQPRHGPRAPRRHLPCPHNARAQRVDRLQCHHTARRDDSRQRHCRDRCRSDEGRGARHRGRGSTCKSHQEDIAIPLINITNRQNKCRCLRIDFISIRETARLFTYTYLQPYVRPVVETAIAFDNAFGGYELTNVLRVAPYLPCERGL